MDAKGSSLKACDLGGKTVEFRIADTFTKVTRNSQGMSLRKIEQSKDKNSGRATFAGSCTRRATSFLLCYVDHNDRGFAAQTLGLLSLRSWVIKLWTWALLTSVTALYFKNIRYTQGLFKASYTELRSEFH